MWLAIAIVTIPFIFVYLFGHPRDRYEPDEPYPDGYDVWDLDDRPDDIPIVSDTGKVIRTRAKDGKFTGSRSTTQRRRKR